MPTAGIPSAPSRPDDPATQALAQAYTIQAARAWEPRITPMNAGIYQIKKGDQLGYAILLNYIEISTNTPNNIVFPFNQG